MLLFDEIVSFRQNRQNLIDATHAAKELLYFCYNTNFQIDLPDFTEEGFGEMPPPIFNPPFDCLRQESPKLLNLFVKDFNPDLGRPRRIQIFKDILRYCTNRERSLLVHIFQNRQIPEITRDDVATVFGGQFFAPRAIPPAPTAPVVPAPRPAVRSRKKEVEMFRPLKSLGYQ
jgi:hypothetical protein